MGGLGWSDVSDTFNWYPLEEREEEDRPRDSRGDAGSGRFFLVVSDPLV